MSNIKDDIVLYKDINGFISPHIVDAQYIRQSDNSCMFTSEYYIMLQKMGELTEADKKQWEFLIRSSMRYYQGLLVRYPGDETIDVPDNFYAVLAASKLLDVPEVSDDILRYGLSHFGFYNGENPGSVKGQDGKIKWPAFQFRQLQMLFAMLVASKHYKWWKFYMWPLELYTALVIATSCYKTDVNDTDARRLAWLLVQTVKDTSLLCKWASVLWFKRLHKDYGEEPMREVAYKYFQIMHPFTRYYVTE